MLIPRRHRLPPPRRHRAHRLHPFLQRIQVGVLFYRRASLVQARLNGERPLPRELSLQQSVPGALGAIEATEEERFDPSLHLAPIGAGAGGVGRRRGDEGPTKGKDWRAGITFWGRGAELDFVFRDAGGCVVHLGRGRRVKRESGRWHERVMQRGRCVAGRYGHAHEKAIRAADRLSGGDGCVRTSHDC